MQIYLQFSEREPSTEGRLLFNNMPLLLNNMPLLFNNMPLFDNTFGEIKITFGVMKNTFGVFIYHASTIYHTSTTTRKPL
mgnify:CR=1 FL=1